MHDIYNGAFMYCWYCLPVEIYILHMLHGQYQNKHWYKSEQLFLYRCSFQYLNMQTPGFWKHIAI